MQVFILHTGRHQYRFPMGSLLIYYRQGSLHPSGVCIQEVSVSRGGVCIQRGGSASGKSASRGLGFGGGLHRRGVCIQGDLARYPTPIVYYGIRSTSRQYASYWNAFLSVSATVFFSASVSVTGSVNAPS